MGRFSGMYGVFRGRLRARTLNRLGLSAGLFIVFVTLISVLPFPHALPNESGDWGIWIVVGGVAILISVGPLLGNGRSSPKSRLREASARLLSNSEWRKTILQPSQFILDGVCWYGGVFAGRSKLVVTDNSVYVGSQLQMFSTFFPHYEIPLVEVTDLIPSFGGVKLRTRNGPSIIFRAGKVGNAKLLSVDTNTLRDSE
jgi:hypothetical protein